MKKYGGFIPGIRAGRPTAEYLDYVLTRITLPGALYLGVISLIPIIALVALNADQQLPLRRHLDPHRRGRGARDGQADRVPAAAAPLRRVPPCEAGAARARRGREGHAGQAAGAATCASRRSPPGTSSARTSRSGPSSACACSRYMDAAGCVPDEVTNDMVRDRLGQADCAGGSSSTATPARWPRSTRSTACSRRLDGRARRGRRAHRRRRRGRQRLHQRAVERGAASDDTARRHPPPPGGLPERDGAAGRRLQRRAACSCSRRHGHGRRRHRRASTRRCRRAATERGEGRRSEPIEFKSPDQIRLMRRAGLVVADALDAVRAALRPGVTTLELDGIAEHVIRRPARRRPSSATAGRRSRRRPASRSTTRSSTASPAAASLRAGDLVSIDCGAILAGWHGDAAFSAIVGSGRAPDADPGDAALVEVTEQAMWRGIAAIAEGNRLVDVGAAIEDSRRAAGFGIVEEYGGHGIGTAMHQAPHVLNYRTRAAGPKLQAGHVPGDRADADAWATRRRACSPTSGPSSPPTARGPRTGSTPSRSPSDGPWVLTARDGGEAGPRRPRRQGRPARRLSAAPGGRRR